MTAWAILTMSVAVFMTAGDTGGAQLERAIERYGFSWTAIGLLVTGAVISAPVALAWAVVKAVVRAVVR